MNCLLHGRVQYIYQWPSNTQWHCHFPCWSLINLLFSIYRKAVKMSVILTENSPVRLRNSRPQTNCSSWTWIRRNLLDFPLLTRSLSYQFKRIYWQTSYMHTCIVKMPMCASIWFLKPTLICGLIILYDIHVFMKYGFIYLRVICFVGTIYL